MKNKVLAFFAAVVAFIASSCADAQSSRTSQRRIAKAESAAEKESNDTVPTFGISDTLITVKRGTRFDIALESNPTTGYAWEVQTDSTKVRHDSMDYVPTKTDQIMCGSGGTDHHLFSALEVGADTITFLYVRPFGERVPAREVRIEVRVEE